MSDRLVIDFDFACQDDCLDRMVPSDLRTLVAERDRLQSRLDELEKQTIRYLDTEGCSCCEANEPHYEALEAIGKIFEWPEYEDGSGTNWYLRRNELEIKS